MSFSHQNAGVRGDREKERKELHEKRNHFPISGLCLLPLKTRQNRGRLGKAGRRLTGFATPARESTVEKLRKEANYEVAGDRACYRLKVGPGGEAVQ